MIWAKIVVSIAVIMTFGGKDKEKNVKRDVFPVKNE